MARFELNDDSVVVIVGSGAGGGTPGNELVMPGANEGRSQVTSA